MADDLSQPTGGLTTADFTLISDVGEFAVIDRMRSVLGEPSDPDVIAGISDDAAVYRIGQGRVHVITTDALAEGVHFDRTFTPMEYLGFKALSVNVSDVAAMNARPRYATLAIGFPSNVTVEMVEALYRGLKQAADSYGLTIVGGDTMASNRMMISITVVGEAREEDVVFRRGARPGDLLCVTGDLGGAYAGLKILLDQREQFRKQGESFVPNLGSFSYVVQRQLLPKARLDAVRDWADKGVRPTALIDISDGLASEVHHLCRQSGCGARIQTSAIPIDLETRMVADHAGEDVDTYALFGGEDYELLFAVSPQDLDKLNPESYAAIGTFTPAGEGVCVQTPEGDVIPLEAGGYQHFGGK
jgi:thiamine-monophosphate kinase